AKAQGKTADGLKQTLLDQAKSDLDKAVADGDLTAKQRDEMLQEPTDHVDDLIQGKGPGPHRFGGPGGPGGPGFGGPGGPGGPGFGPPPRFERHSSGSGSSSSSGSGSSNAPGSFQTAPSTGSGAA